MRVIIEFDHNTDREIVSMAEDWLKRLAGEIKEKDHTAAEEKARADHELVLIKEHGSVLWRSFTDFLIKYVGDMKADLHEDITLQEGPLDIRVEPKSGKIDINKEAFPYVSFMAAPQYPQRIAQVFYAVFNPKAPAGSHSNTVMPCRFEVNPQNRVYLQLDGKPFHEANEAAKYIMEKLFTIPN